MYGEPPDRSFLHQVGLLYVMMLWGTVTSKSIIGQVTYLR